MQRKSTCLVKMQSQKYVVDVLPNMYEIPYFFLLFHFVLPSFANKSGHVSLIFYFNSEIIR